MKKKLIIGIVILVAVAASGIYYYTQGTGGEDYDTALVQKGSIEKYIEETGEIASKNIRGYYGNGTNEIENLYVEIGDSVNEGDLLLEYDNTVDLEIEKINKQIEALEATYNEAVSGADFEQINTAKLEIESIKNNLEYGKENLETIEELYENDAATEKEYKDAKNRVEQLENQLAIAQNQYSLLVKGLSGNVRDRYEAEIEVLALSLKILEENREKYNIFAAFNGIITELDTFQGDMPLAGKKVLEIQEINNLRAYGDFIVEDAVKIDKGMSVEIYNDDIDLRIENLQIEKIHPKALSKLSELGIEQKRVTIEVNLPKDQKDLIIGSKITLRIKIDGKENILIVPEEAVYEKNEKTYVEILENGEAKEIEVTTGIENDDYIEILEGLTEGQEVILE
ncbi:MAG: HlyD family efflux transporter periplasmic adaptor subunit [Bacillota bacterium]|nr:HlyD family efflux transporter periplasmic adaptor subunit [Bacillota bacterium]